MKRLIIGNSKTVFAKELQNELVNKGLDVYLLDFEYLELYDSKYNLNDIYSKRFAKYKSIPKLHMFFRMMYIKKVIQENDFDIVNIHMSRWFYLIILPWLMKQKFVITFYGSDFYRTSNFIKNIQKLLYNKADAITFTNPLTKKSFIEYYKDYESKSHVCRFGLKTLDFIDKNRDKDKKEIKKYLGYSTDKIIVTCGYNSTKAQQHDKIIENIKKLPREILKNVQFIFPMTYGDIANKEAIKNILTKSDLDYIILEDFLRRDDNAYIKLASDIMINMLETDSFSGSMQEFLYAKNIVITGSWLPYDIFDSEGVIYQKIDSADMLADKLKSILNDLKSYKINLDKNIDIILKLSSWNKNINCWMEVLSCK